MPNYCNYEMMIKGEMQSCKEWMRRVSDYSAPNHFWRMFDTIDIIEEYGDSDNYTIRFVGDCAWSIESCCRSSGYSGGIDLFEVNTRELLLTMEVYSSEPGCQFQEHYIYKNGECECSECVDYAEYYWNKSEFESFSEFSEAYNLNSKIKESDFDDDGYLYVGGFKEWEFTI